MRESLVNNGLGWSRDCDARLLEFEANALHECLARGALQYDEFGPGETMLILPRGGHAVLTGDPHKVVIAGEWHLLPDGERALALPKGPVPARRPRTRKQPSRSPSPPPLSPPPPAERPAAAPATDGNASDGDGDPRAPRVLALRRTPGDAARDAADCGAVEYGAAAAGSVLVAVHAARAAAPRAAFRCHLRPDWAADAWLRSDVWSDVALEADVSLCADAKASAVVVGSLCRRELATGPDATRLDVDDEALARFAAAAAPCRVRLAAAATDAILDAADDADGEAAARLFARLRALGLEGAYVTGRPGDAAGRDRLVALAAAAKAADLVLVAALPSPPAQGAPSPPDAPLPLDAVLV